ncbi:hypothetical protein [Salmonirosea aquatica]|uniref:Uncharacterized protein n=1 Tax=Salmonirosea aquatica TaxID=2654236 RepID=A0A7C9BKC1_9BACT|nr:hypothetical protein [Cytophagaceae bacterium SJW1-29]
MRKTLILLCLALTGYLSARSQSVNGVSIRNLKSEHAIIAVTPVLLSPKVTIDIDFGQEDKALVTKDTEVRDENDRPVQFNSAVDALNFMSTMGYEFVQAYTLTSSSNDSIVSTVYYLLKKKKLEQEK